MIIGQTSTNLFPPQSPALLLKGIFFHLCLLGLHSVAYTTDVLSEFFSFRSARTESPVVGRAGGNRRLLGNTILCYMSESALSHCHNLTDNYVTPEKCLPGTMIHAEGRDAKHIQECSFLTLENHFSVKEKKITCLHLGFNLF